MNFDYEPDEDPKRKHHWDEPLAGFSERDGLIVGKCPSTMTRERARELLNTGIPHSHPRWGHDHPCRIFIVDRGVLYRAKPTNPGRSYHAFPVHRSEWKWGSELKESGASDFSGVSW